MIQCFAKYFLSVIVKIQYQLTNVSYKPQIEIDKYTTMIIWIDHLLFLRSDDIIRSLEENDQLLNKPAILF